MSLVGPRPLPMRDYELLEPWHRRRYNVLPGMTGLWQVAGRSDLTFDDLVRLDFYYIENWSIWLDISILLKTPFAVFVRARRVLAAQRPLRRRNPPLRHLRRARAEDPRRRVRRRPRLPLRLHSCLVAALEGAVRGRRRPDRHALPRAADRVAVVAHRAEPDLRRGRVVRARARRRRARQGRPLPAPRRGEPRGRPRRPDDARGDLALGDAALAEAPRSADRARAAGRGDRLHRADGAPARHPDARCASSSASRSSSTTATCR